MAAAFDTMKAVNKLKNAGFTPEQAEGSVIVMSDILAESVATKADLENSRVSLKADIDGLRVELTAKIDALADKLTVRLGMMLLTALAAAGGTAWALLPRLFVQK